MWRVRHLNSRYIHTLHLHTLLPVNLLPTFHILIHPRTNIHNFSCHPQFTRRLRLHFRCHLQAVVPRVDKVSVTSICIVLAYLQFTEAPDRTNILVSFPINSGVIGVAATTRMCLWDTRKLFAEFWLQMCTNMQLNPQTAVIGYKISSDRVKDPVTSANLGQ